MTTTDVTPTSVPLVEASTAEAAEAVRAVRSRRRKRILLATFGLLVLAGVMIPFAELELIVVPVNGRAVANGRVWPTPLSMNVPRFVLPRRVSTSFWAVLELLVGVDPTRHVPRCAL